MMKKLTLAPLEKPVSVLAQGSVMMRRDDLDWSFALLDACLENGINTFDLAWIYNKSDIVGKWVRSRGVRKDVVLYTKLCHPSGGPRVSPENFEADLHAELERSGLDYFDVVGFHRDDPSVPVGELVDVAVMMQEQGLMLGTAVSNWLVPRIEEFDAYAESIGHPGLLFNNPNMSLATVNEPMWVDCHTLPQDEYDWHVQTGKPLWSWSSTGGGFFAEVESDDVRRVYHNAVNFGRLAWAKEWGSKHGMSPVQVALAWVLRQPFSTVAIVGSQTVEQVKDNARTAQMEIADSDWAEFLAGLSDIA